jgi:hypothetical protein
MITSKKIEERIDLFYISWSFQGTTIPSKVNHDVKKYDFLSEKYLIKIIFYQNGSVIYTESNWEDLLIKLNPSLWEDDDQFEIVLSFDKSKHAELIIVEQASFLDGLPKSPEKIISFWNEIFTTYKTLSIFRNGNILIDLQSFDRLKTNTLFNDLEISKSVSITPENLYNLREQLADINIEIFYNHLTETISLFCLKLFCSKYRDSTSIQFIFEGYNSYIIENPKLEQLREISDTLYTIYQWTFSDSNASSKLGILRNLVSLSNTKNIEKCFTKNLLKSIFSNYQVYMKENVKQYFEIKNKVTELMFGLLNKSFDIYDQYKTTSRNTALAVISYFFTVIITRAIGKQQDSTLFTPEVTSISLVFIFSAIIYIFMVHSDLLNKNKSIQNSVNELRSRYEQIICEEEIEELFNSKSLSNSINDNSTTKYHYYSIGVLVTLLFCVLYFTIRSLGLDYFVKLFSGA